MRYLLVPLAGLALMTAMIPTVASADEGCYDSSLPTTVEESRLTVPTVPGADPASEQFLEAGGFTGLVQTFRSRLCEAGSVSAAARVVAGHGDRLWRTAVARAQGRLPGMGTIDRYDDRPLYWAHLSATSALRQWKPGFGVGDKARARLVRAFADHARGLSDIRFPRKGGKRMLISGFDPYRLEDEPRRSNPSGAAALQLDGRRIETAQGTVQVETVMLPVTWSGFNDGIVERAFGPSLASRTVDLIMTISQGRTGRMDVEQWAGRWRGGFPDNNLEGTPEVVPPAKGWPQPAPEFIETTLPHEVMVSAGTGPWPVKLNPELCEWPAGTFPDPDKVSCHANGPSEGSRAQAGGGGNYLSNESMYRSNRLRIGLKAKHIPGGHLHIAALSYPADPAVLIDEEFQSGRQATVDQTVSLVEAAGGALR